jgi:outer membrane protein OmpA-like peptidoglycan-associated protein
MLAFGVSTQAQGNVISRSTPAVNYRHHSGSTKIDFKGTTLMPGAHGEAKVNSGRGTMKIEVDFAGLQSPKTFGTEYLTYVLWAISPEGRAVNIGEVLVGGNDRSKLAVTTDLQAFAMIVTAEPYYAVRRPSDVVIMENDIRPDTVGTAERVDAKYELTGRGGYIPTGYVFDPVLISVRLPLEFYEARNAVRIAESEGADRYATASYGNAIRQLKEADAMASRRNVETKQLIAASREVVQTAEDSREIAMKARETESGDARNRASAGREADAKAQSVIDAKARRRAEDAEANANAGKANAEAGQANAQAGQANAEADKMEAERRRKEAERTAADAQTGQANAEADKMEAERRRKEAERTAADAQTGQQNAQADADRNRAAAATAQQQKEAAEAESERNKAAAASSDQQLQQAVRDREELRARLLIQLNAILMTRDTARGLVVNMSDVLFDTGKYTLRPAAREKLAKISGIILAYPTLTLAIEGNTDSVGGDAYNQDLSEKRADAVRDYLAEQKIPGTSMTSKGFGKTQPVATNDTADGRQANRRVELVVSGEVIGTTIGVVVVVPGSHPQQEIHP